VGSYFGGGEEPLEQAFLLGNYATGSINAWTFFGRTGEPDSSASHFTFSRETTIEDIAVAELEGDVESIEGDEAVLVVKIAHQYVERLVPASILKAKGADFEGARVRLIIKEKGGLVTSEIRNISNEEKPQWLAPNEELGEILSQLKARLSKQKSH
jgi:hypothetical protein